MKTHTEEAMHTKAGKQGLWVLAAVAMALALLVNCGPSEDDPTPVPDAGQADSGTNPTPDSGTNPEPDAGTNPDTDAGTNPDTDAGTNPDTDAGTNPDTDAGTNPDPDAGTNPDPDAGTNPDPDAGTNPDPDGGTDPDPDGGTDPEPVCASDVPCREQSIDRLNLLTTVSTGALYEETAPAGEFRSYIDARAGGLTVNQSYTYARFTSEGLSRVSIDDQTALGTPDWDIAFRRYYIRVNGGTSGPSCVSVARLPTGTRFETVTSVDPGLTFQTDAWYTDTCEFLPDDSGLNGPTMALSSFWRYQACVAMTGDVFIIRLADGRHVKFEVTSYYDPEPQRVCNETNQVPQPSGSGQLRVKWAFLP